MHINTDWLSKCRTASSTIRSQSKNIIVIVLLLVAGCVRRNPVEAEFDWVSKEMSIQGKTVRSLFAWYKVVELSETDKRQLMMANLMKKHYGKWSAYKSTLSFPDGYSINGVRDKIIRASKMGSDERDGIFLFVNLDNNQLIMVYGKTYGM